MKKKIIPIVVLILVLGVIAVMVFGNKQKEKNLDEEMPVEEATEYIQSYYGMVKWNEMVSKYDKDSNKDINEEIKKEYETFLSKLNVDKLNFQDLVRVIYIDEKMGLSEYKKYETYLGDYYNEDKKVFCYYKCNKMDEEYDFYDEAVDETMLRYPILTEMDIDLSNFDVVSGLVKYYEKHNNDKNTQIIYTLSEVGCIDRIDLSKRKSEFEKLYNENLDEVKSDSYIVNYESIGITSFLDICDAMGIDTSELRSITKSWSIGSEVFEEMDDSSLTYPLYIECTYWEDVWNETGMVKVDDKFLSVSADKYKEFFNKVLKQKTDEFLDKYK